MSTVYDALPQDMKNPYRAGSKKAQAFEICRAGGERAALVAKVEQLLGVSNATACTWVSLFRKVK
ncbi:MAG: hypothetical protein EPO20_16070 [Betaproteobacteria bacterium]|nr:MAG: hypothetical protein EPO20_16070 [Betaproteobacteria bacterium]